MKTTGERGPIYGVELIDSLPLGTGGFSQAMPSREDLENSRKHGDRIAAGYEVLLRHYTDAVEEIERLQKRIDSLLPDPLDMEGILKD